jgi:predicted RNase H-like HicB family nuclease
MIRYVGILEKEPESLWGVYVPDLPGCVAAADTSDGALDQASEALRLWVEDAYEAGEVLPRARTVEELRRDPIVAEAIAAGHAAVVLSVAPDPEDSETLRIIDEAAGRRGLSRAALLREAVLDKLAG